MNICIKLCIICLAILVSGCAHKATQQAKTSQDDGILPMPYTVTSPSNTVLFQEITQHLKNKKAPLNSRYDFERIDLNGDGRLDAIVYMKTPFTYWCGIDGCAMTIFKATNGGFIPIGDIKPVRNPITVSDNKTRGWKDIIIRVDGKWSEAKDIILKFDGSTYPKTPNLSEEDMKLEDRLSENKTEYQIHGRTLFP